MVVSLHPVSAAFDRAVQSVRTLEFRSELRVQEIRSPKGLAPRSFALAADVNPGDLDGDSQLGTARFILLHDPSEPASWQGDFRVICYVQAPLEIDLGADTLLPNVAWTWLLETLDQVGAHYHQPSGTVTITSSKGFGALSEQSKGSQIELRASWTPRDTTLSEHATAWSQLLCILAGLPPLDSHDISTLRRTVRTYGRS